MKTVIFVILFASLSHAQTTTTSAQLPTQPTEQAAPEWKPTKAFAGDLRLRFRDQKLSSNPDPRFYEQLRARLSYRADIQEDMTGILRFATATSPVSANQTLGDPAAPGMPRREFGLDLAYLEYRPIAHTQVWAGKTPVTFYSPAANQLIYDADMDFEGASVKWQSEPGDLSYFANLGTSLVSENFGGPSGDVPDLALLGAQVGASIKTFGMWTADVAYYTWDNAQGRTGNQVTGTAVAAGARSFGNTTDASGALASKFDILQASIDWQHAWDAVTTEFFYDFGRNDSANLGAASYETGVIVKYKNLQFGFANVVKEADSQLGAFVDSDSNGGGTDNAGYRANVAWQVTKPFSIVATDYWGKRAISTASPLVFSEARLDLMGTF